MIVQGTSLVNTTQIDDLTSAINGANSCAELQATVNVVMDSINGQIKALELQLAALAPIALINLGSLTSIGSIVTAIGKIIAPSVLAYANIIATQAAMVTAIANLTAAITAAQARFTSCTITIPPPL